MKVFIKNKLISWGGSSTVLNEQEQPIFNVKGKIFSPTKKKFMYDMNGKLLYIIRNKWWTFMSDKVLIYNADKERIACIKKNRFSWNLKYQIEDTIDNMSIEGKFFSGKSNIMRNGQPVGVITRKFTIVNDAFTLEADESDIPFLTALVIGFDNLKDQKENNRD